LQGAVVADENATTKLIPLGKTRLVTSRWVLHNKVGYFTLDDSPMTVFSGAASGSWSSINTRYNDASNSVTDKVLRIQIPHTDGKTPSGFGILLAADEEKLASLQTISPWKVLKNDHACQALKFKNGTVMAAFYEPGKIGPHSEKAKDASFRVDQPCLAMWNEKEAWLCDPTGEGIKINVEWNGEKQKVMLPKKGALVSLKLH
jgi:chondroitin AC lyase